MKNHSSQRVFRNFAILILLLFMGSCLDYTVTTKVNRDGSIFRQYRVRGDSTEIFKGSLMIPSGSEWKISHSWGPKDEKDTLSGETKYVYLASHTFRNIDELNSWLATDTSFGSVKPDVTLKKQFRWFYTYYSYSEIYPMLFPFQKIPVDSFLTDLEQSVILDDDRTAYSPEEKKLIWKVKDTVYQYNKADSVEMNKLTEHCQVQFTKWMLTSIIEDYLDLIHEHFRNDQASKAISLKKSELNRTVYEKYGLTRDKFMSASLINRMGDSLIGSKRLEELYVQNPDVFADFDRKILQVNDIGIDDSFLHSLTLPGKLFSTNSTKINQSEMEWELEPMAFFMKDYEMKASSRAANPWIMVLSGLMVVGLIGVLFARRK